MLHPHFHAKNRPEHPAVIMASTGETVSFGQLEAQSNQVAHLMRSHGLQRGDHIDAQLADYTPPCASEQPLAAAGPVAPR